MSLVARLLLVGAFVGANVVAGGVLSLLGPQVLALEDGLPKALAVIAVGVLAVTCALIFLRGCMRGKGGPLQYRGDRRAA